MERSTYTVTHHGLLIGLYGKTLEEHLREYGLDIFANAIMRYAHEGTADAKTGRPRRTQA